MNENEAQHRGETRVSTVGRSNDRGGTGGGGDVRPTPPKHYIPIYRNLSNIGAVSGGGLETRSMGDRYMVGAGRIGIGGSTDDGKGNGGADGRVGRRRRDEVLMQRG